MKEHFPNIWKLEKHLFFPIFAKYFWNLSILQNLEKWCKWSTMFIFYRWPFKNRNYKPPTTTTPSPNNYWNQSVMDSNPDHEYPHVEPVGLLVIFVFCSVLFFQLIGMLMHRILTLGHVVSTTDIGIVKVWKNPCNFSAISKKKLFMTYFHFIFLSSLPRGTKTTSLILTRCSMMREWKWWNGCKWMCKRWLFWKGFFISVNILQFFGTLN